MKHDFRGDTVLWDLTLLYLMGPGSSDIWYTLFYNKSKITFFEENFSQTKGKWHKHRVAVGITKKQIFTRVSIKFDSLRVFGSNTQNRLNQSVLIVEQTWFSPSSQLQFYSELLFSANVFIERTHRT